MTEGATPERRVNRRAAAWALGLAFLLGVIEAVKGYLAGRDAPNDFGWDEALLTNVPWWLLWGLLALLVFRLVDRFPLRGETLRSSVAVHVTASLLLSLLHLSVSAVIVWAAVSHAFSTLEGQLRRFVVGFLVTDLVTYWAIAAAYGAWRSQRETRRAERERQALELRNARLESRMIEARLEALRRELNPHFLFNTLNSVSALAQQGEGEKAVVALSRLSELLRHVLDDDLDEQVTVEEELGLLDLYLDIVRLRYGDRLTVEVRVEPATRRALMPALLLQPLVENAVKHGVESVRGPVRLDVCARRRDRLELSVRDSGRGLFRPRTSSRSGVGLDNTRARLRTLYGDAAEVRLRDRGERDGERGAEAVVRLPLTLEEEVRLGA